MAVCMAGAAGAILFILWSLCRASGGEKEQEDQEQEEYLKKWREQHSAKSSKSPVD